MYCSLLKIHLFVSLAVLLKMIGCFRIVNNEVPPASSSAELVVADNEPVAGPSAQSSVPFTEHPASADLQPYGMCWCNVLWSRRRL